MIEQSIIIAYTTPSWPLSFICNIFIIHSSTAGRVPACSRNQSCSDLRGSLLTTSLIDFFSFAGKCLGQDWNLSPSWGLLTLTPFYHPNVHWYPLMWLHYSLTPLEGTLLHFVHRKWAFFSYWSRSPMTVFIISTSTLIFTALLASWQR